MSSFSISPLTSWFVYFICHKLFCLSSNVFVKLSKLFSDINFRIYVSTLWIYSNYSFHCLLDRSIFYDANPILPVLKQKYFPTSFALLQNLFDGENSPAYLYIDSMGWSTSLEKWRQWCIQRCQKNDPIQESRKSRDRKCTAQLLCEISASRVQKISKFVFFHSHMWPESVHLAASCMKTVQVWALLHFDIYLPIFNPPVST